MISVWDVDTIYKIPQMLHDQGLDAIVCDKLGIDAAAGRPVDVEQADPFAGESEDTKSPSAWSASTST